MQILPFELAPDIDRVYEHFVQEIQNDPELPSADDLVQMYTYCPYNALSIRFLALRAANSLGEYTHSSEQLYRVKSGKQTLTEWVKSNFQTMRGDLSQSIKKMLTQACCLGHSVAEVVYTSEMPGHKGEWRLSKLKVLDPNLYTFAGKNGEWDRIIYKSSRRGEYPIPRQKLIHLYFPSVREPENPIGLALGIRGYPYYKARTLTLKTWNKQIVRNLKGMTIIQGDSNDTVIAKDILGVPLYDTTGKPLTKPAVEEHVNKIAKAEDGAIIGLDKKFTYQHYPQTGNNSGDFNQFLIRCCDDIFMAYGIPKTIFGEGSAALGQAGLSYGHRLTLDIQIEDTILSARSQILEMIVRPLLSANFGLKEQDDFGSFDTDNFLPPEQSQMRANLISSGMLQGLIDPNDLEAINQYRKDCGLTPVSAEKYNEIQVRKMIEAQQQQEAMMQQQGEGIE